MFGYVKRGSLRLHVGGRGGPGIHTGPSGFFLVSAVEKQPLRCNWSPPAFGGVTEEHLSLKSVSQPFAPCSEVTAHVNALT